MNPRDFCFVSCDIVGHGIETDFATQKNRIEGINDIVRTSVDTGGGQVVWASGGDGGHVAFTLPGGAKPAIHLMAQLQHWSVQNDVALRITGHVGAVVNTVGADGRVQLVGDGINVCGSLLDFGAPKSIVVSEAFRNLMERERESAAALRFKDDRTVYLKHFSSCRLFLMDIEGQVMSQWGAPTKSDHHLLDEALTRRIPWNVIYHAKRLLQLNTEDARAKDALQEVAKRNVGELVAKSRFADASEHNRFLDGMDPNTFFEFAKGAELVERDNGEFFCHYDEEGDSMFIVLTGEVGVVIQSAATDSDESRAKPLDVRFGPGHMVGELAFALRRRRTAALQAIGQTAVLAFNYKKLEEVFRRSKAPEMMRRDNQNFLEARTLEYLCNHASYLIGKDRRGPLATTSHPWRYMERGFAETLHIEADETSVISPSDERLAKDGLYIVASGELARVPEDTQGKMIVDGRRLPIMYVDFPRTLVHIHHTYRLRSEHAVIVRISHQAFVNMGRSVFEDAVKALRQALATQFVFDVFLAYNSVDQPMAVRWSEALRQAGLSVYMNVPSGGQHFKPEIVTAILDSAVLLPLISKTVSATPRGKQKAGEESWVHREVQLRRAMFDPAHANIVPIQLPGGHVPNVVDGITPIAVDEAGPDNAIERVIARILEIRKSSSPIPFATRRTTVPADFR